MRPRPTHVSGAALSEPVRYVINGSGAAVVHYAALIFCLHVLEFRSAGLGNLCAAAVGITASFFGNRYYVFRRDKENILRQAAKFGVLYATIALLHGAILYLWTDVRYFDYRIGFLIALVLQVILSYWGNKTLVFNYPARSHGIRLEHRPVLLTTLSSDRTGPKPHSR
jgi:putative flippase GtrA